MKRITVRRPDEARTRAADEWVSGAATHILQMKIHRNTVR